MRAGGSVVRAWCVALIVGAAVAAIGAGGCGSAGPPPGAQSGVASPSASSTSPGAADLDARLVAAIDRMSLRQKVGQVFMIGIPGTAVTAKVKDLMTTVRPGGVLLMGDNIVDSGQLRSLTAGLQKLSRAKTRQPLFIATDQEGGEVRRVPWIGGKLSQAEMRSAEEAYTMGLRRGRGLVRLGIDLDLAPVLDLGVPGDFLTAYGRCFSGGPRRVGELGRSVIEGQKRAGIMSAAKHFPGYGGVVDDPETTHVAVRQSPPEYGQFAIAAEAEPEFVMAAVDIVYRSVDKELAFSMSPRGIELLRESVPGDYLVISDALDTRTMIERYGLKNVVVSSFAAGVDVLLIGPGQHAPRASGHLLSAVRSGRISETELDRRVLAILRQKAEHFGE